VEEAVAMLREAVALYLEDESVPNVAFRLTIADPS
jgi:predicted RNase H-like HicB family nuclease